MQLSPTGRKLLMTREGVRLKAYRDTRGIWTIGVGHTSMAGPPRVWPWSRLTLSEAELIFSRDIRPYEAAVNRVLLRGKTEISQNAFDACVSLCYNIGESAFVGSSVARQIVLGNLEAAADDFLLFDRPSVLLRRREEERAQFLR